MDRSVSIDKIEGRIFQIRGKRVMLDIDLAGLYGVPTKALNQAVKRNIKRFPDDFMFALTAHEKDDVVTNCDHLKNLKFSPYLPYAFTQEGVAMLSSVLQSSRETQAANRISAVIKSCIFRAMCQALKEQNIYKSCN